MVATFAPVLKIRNLLPLKSATKYITADTVTRHLRPRPDTINRKTTKQLLEVPVFTLVTPVPCNLPKTKFPAVMVL